MTWQKLKSCYGYAQPEGQTTPSSQLALFPFYHSDSRVSYSSMQSFMHSCSIANGEWIFLMA